MASPHLPSSARGAVLRRWLLLPACLVVVSWCGGAWPASAVEEYQVKAAYLFNFGQFVEWPDQSYDSPGAPFVIGVVGEDPFGQTLDELIEGESLGGHPLVIKRFRRAKDISACNILFIGRSETARLGETIKALKGGNVLTVTDIMGAERQGVIIVLFNEKNRIRMRINVAAAKASNLTISSNLLRPAEVVGNDGG